MRPIRIFHVLNCQTSGTLEKLTLSMEKMLEDESITILKFILTPQFTAGNMTADWRGSRYECDFNNM